MKKLIHKFKNWYRGKHIPYSIQEMFDLQQPRYLERQKPIAEKFEQPLIASILNFIAKFGLRHLKWILGFVVSLIGLYIAYLKL